MHPIVSANTARHLLPEAKAQQTLEGVGCRVFGWRLPAKEFG
jgi:hypothetical protein